MVALKGLETFIEGVYQSPYKPLEDLGLLITLYKSKKFVSGHVNCG